MEERERENDEESRREIVMRRCRNYSSKFVI
jgi:hypothetical protein